jgi:hypothetical protein
MCQERADRRRERGVADGIRHRKAIQRVGELVRLRHGSAGVVGVSEHRTGDVGKQGHQFQIVVREAGATGFVDDLEDTSRLVFIGAGNAEHAVRAREQGIVAIGRKTRVGADVREREWLTRGHDEAGCTREWNATADELTRIISVRGSHDQLVMFALEQPPARGPRRVDGRRDERLHRGIGHGHGPRLGNAPESRRTTFASAGRIAIRGSSSTRFGPNVSRESRRPPAGPTRTPCLNASATEG